ncbi:pectinesterase QRT1-like [Senna tora]|uniref:pectinesterase n=1 Tax=Senna tora TaxID=362788 RepID=A0A834WQX9_9FABA|nr:pectinesterase QRT1-like [Senna tora]
MVPTIFFLLLYLLLLPTNGSAQIHQEEGFISAAVSETGLDYAKDLLIHKAISSILQLQLPKIEKSASVRFVGNCRIVLSNISITDVRIGSSYVKTGEKGVTLVASGATANMSMKWGYSCSTWLLPIAVSDSGDASVKVKGMQMGLTADLKNQEGTLQLVLLDYGCYVGELSIKVEGGASWLYQRIVDLFGGEIASAVENSISEEIREGISKLNNSLQSLPKQIPLDETAVLNISFVDNPVLTNSSIEFEINGLFTRRNEVLVSQGYHRESDISSSCGGSLDMIKISLHEDVIKSASLVYFNAIGDGEGSKNIRAVHRVKEKEQGNKPTFKRTLRIFVEDGGKRRVQWELERQATEEPPKKGVPLTTVEQISTQVKQDGRLLCWVPRAQSQVHQGSSVQETNVMKRDVGVQTEEYEIVVLGDVRGVELAGMGEKGTKVGEGVSRSAPCKGKAKMDAQDNTIVTLRDPSTSGGTKCLEPETDSSSSEAEEGEFLDEASIISFFDNEEGLLIEQLEKEYEDQERDQKRRLDDGLEGVASLLEMDGGEGDIRPSFFPMASIDDQALLNTAGWRFIVPQLYKRYPNDEMKLNISVSSPPIVEVTNQDISATIFVDLIIDVLDAGDVIPVACISMEISASCSAKIFRNNIAGSLILNNFSTYLKWSKIGRLHEHLIQQGNGHSTTVQGAVDMVPIQNRDRVKIYIFPGIYRERVFVPRTKPYISFIGKENETHGVVITWNSKSSDIGFNGQALGTYGSATVTVESDYFCANRITFENSVVAVPGGRGMQGVAVRVDSERAMFYQVKFLGTQDTLLDNIGTHYFLNCLIQGKIDFICGSAKSLYEDCHLRSISENHGAIAAHRRDTPYENTGFSFLGCSIEGTGKVYLGRAWGNYSRIIYSNCYMEDIITPEGWTEWNHPSRKMTAVFGEFQCRGRGANRSGRVPWSRSFNYEEARPFLDKSFINGDNWLRL